MRVGSVPRGGTQGRASIPRISTVPEPVDCLSGLVSILGIVFVEEIFAALGASESMMPHVVDYMTVWFAGILLIVGPMVASNILRALGNATVPGLVMIAAAVINLILDPIYFWMMWLVSWPGVGCFRGCLGNRGRKRRHLPDGHGLSRLPGKAD